jgi:hypothetical protein
VPDLPTSEGWHPDPDGVHQHRYFNGTAWTIHVANDGVSSEAALRADEPRHIQQLRRYAEAIGLTMKSFEETLKIANRAVGARRQSQERPQHEISIKHFQDYADEADAEFVPLLKDFLRQMELTRVAAAEVLSGRPEGIGDPEMLFMVMVEDETYRAAGVIRHALDVDFGTTPQQFLDGLEATNAKVRADIYGYGEPGFIGVIHAPPVAAISDERPCPWCAETIKTAAVICRFCNREVSMA